MQNTRAVTSEMTMKIVRALTRGPLRFNEIDRAVNARNHPVLSERLKKMQRDGLIERRVIKLGPPAHVEYMLTPLGADLAKPVKALLGWVDAHAAELQAAREYHTAIESRRQ